MASNDTLADRAKAFTADNSNLFDANGHAKTAEEVMAGFAQAERERIINDLQRLRNNTTGLNRVSALGKDLQAYIQQLRGEK